MKFCNRCGNRYACAFPPGRIGCSIEPRRGYWTLPAGFMENGETVQQAAQRETCEEACARLQDLQLYTLSTCHTFSRCACSCAPNWPTRTSRPVPRACRPGFSGKRRSLGLRSLFPRWAVP